MNKKNGLSRNRREKTIRAFCADLTATQAAQIHGFSRTTVNRYYGLFRAAIHAHQLAMKDKFTGVVEVDESFFGASRPRGVPPPGRPGRATLKQPVFGVFERGGRVFTEIVPDATKKTLQKVIRGRVALDATIVSDGWRAYDGLVDVGYDAHLRVRKRSFHVENGVHINGIESFRSCTRRRLAKFNGTTVNFELHLKEGEWRWRKDPDTLFAELKKLLV